MRFRNVHSDRGNMAAKRERSSNWSIAEISILTDFVEKNEEILKAKQSNLITSYSRTLVNMRGKPEEDYHRNHQLQLPLS